MSVRFNDGTSLEKMTESVRPIPMELFRFMPYSRLLKLANTGKQLPDVRGELSAIRSTITDRIPGAQRVMLTLRLESGDSVCVSMFDSKALEFHAKFDSYGKEPRVIVATSVNPKLVGGNLPKIFSLFHQWIVILLLCVFLRLCLTPIVFISSGDRLVREVSVLKSECPKLKEDIERLHSVKTHVGYNSKDQDNFPTTYS
ncbi:OB-fold-like protein [Raphanus sativus]|nr:OB-fold-like protein [Raphanus sativus]